MRKLFLAGVCACVGVGAVFGDSRAIPFPEALQDAGMTVSKMTDGQREGLIVGNGALYGVLWEKDGELCLRITRNEIWDARIDTSNDGPIPRVNVRTRAVTGSTGAPPSYGNPYPQPRCAAAIRISGARPALAKGQVDLQRAVMSVTAGKGERSEVRVLADRNVVLLNTAGKVTIEEILAGTLPRARTGTTGGVAWLHMVMPGDLDYKGMEYCVAVAGEGTTKAVSLVTSFDDTKGDVCGTAVALAARTLAEAGQSTGTLIANHERVWADYWARSGVALADRDLQRWWYRMLYFARTVCPSGGRFPPAIMPPLVTDNTPWHADYHFNYNSWQPFWSVVSVNHADLADSWIAYVDGLLPRAQWQAREMFGCDGVFYSISQYLHEPDPAVCKSVNKRSTPMNPWGMTIGMMGMTVQSLWHRYLCDPDRALLETKIYPTLKESARFYLSFMKQCGRDSDGKVLLGPSYSPEHGGMGIDNCPFDIAYVHYTFDAFGKAARVLGKDQALVAECLAMKALLPDYPVALDTQGQPIVVDWRGCRYKEVDMHNLTVPAVPVFPAEQVTWFSPEPVKALFRRTIRDTRFNGNNSHVIFNIAKARLSMPEAVGDTRQWFKSRELPNGLFVWQGHQHGTFMPESIGVAALVTEFLMQSAGDIIRVFPCWAKDQAATFSHLRAQGGFLVSASQQEGKVVALEITSTVGGPLRVLSPWPAIRVKRGWRGPRLLKPDAQGIVTLNTKPGEHLVFSAGD
ncbi:MAG: hypothetical protein WCO77_02010 [bacterium]